MADLPERSHKEEPLSQAMEDYLKCIYRLEESTGKAISTQEIANRMSVAPPSVTHMIKRLAGRKLLTYHRYHGVQLTVAGRRVASEMVRHHRLLELFLTQALGFADSEVHAEAERLEHFISEALEQRIDAVLGYPSRDPHGSPIPPCGSAETTRASACTLRELELYSPATVLNCPRELRKEHFAAGAFVVVLGKPPGAMMHVRVGVHECLISPEKAAEVEVARSNFSTD